MKIQNNKIVRDIYWQERLKSLQHPQGKMRAVVAANQLLKNLYEDKKKPLRVIELGCGEGHILGDLLKLCAADDVPIEMSVGIDSQPDAIEKAEKFYPQTEFILADYVNLSVDFQPFDLVMFVGTLHEIYSSKYSTQLMEINQIVGQEAVFEAISNNFPIFKEHGYILIFDGVDHSLPGTFELTIRFKSKESFNEFRKFVDEYKAFQINYYQTQQNNCVNISVHNFTRYITKTRFINSDLWEIEKWESYQYFKRKEFIECLEKLDFNILNLDCASPHIESWKKRVEILTPKVNFPEENILIIGQRKS
ncbi:MAG: methyltransferase domain-containing protein [Pyrinomonadaceae bacterium]|nr:methyltransferase domain-containing protein [Pyrinomonadaceae bacterium]